MTDKEFKLLMRYAKCTNTYENLRICLRGLELTSSLDKKWYKNYDIHTLVNWYSGLPTVSYYKFILKSEGIFHLKN